MKYALFCLAVFGAANVEAADFDRSSPGGGAPASLPRMEIVARPGPGLITVREHEFVAREGAIQEQFAVSTTELNRANTAVVAADSQLSRVENLLLEEVEEEKQEAIENAAVRADQKQIAEVLKATKVELGKMAAAYQQAMNNLIYANGQINAAHAEIQRQMKTAWIPAPISTVGKLVGLF